MVSIHLADMSDGVVIDVNEGECGRNFASFRLPLMEGRPLIERSAIEPTVPVSSNDAPVVGLGEVLMEEF